MSIILTIYNQQHAHFPHIFPSPQKLALRAQVLMSKDSLDFFHDFLAFRDDCAYVLSRALIIVEYLRAIIYIITHYS